MAELQLGVPPNQERSYTVEETDTQGILYTARYTIEEKGRPPLLVIKKRSLVANHPGQGGRRRDSGARERSRSPRSSRSTPRRSSVDTKGHLFFISPNS